MKPCPCCGKEGFLARCISCGYPMCGHNHQLPNEYQLTSVADVIADLTRKGNLLISEGHVYCGYGMISSANDLIKIVESEKQCV